MVLRWQRLDFKKKCNGVEEGTGGGAALSGTAFDTDENDALGCGDTCNGV